MGDRVSIQFKDKWGDLSPYLYSHWGGMDVVNAAKEFVKTYRNYDGAGDVLAQFIQSDFAMKIDDLHVEFEDGVDNDDNGNHVIDIETGESTKSPRWKPKKEPTKDDEMGMIKITNSEFERIEKLYISLHQAFPDRKWNEDLIWWRNRKMRV